MILPFSFTANALSATTANVIRGTEPYLTFDGSTPATDIKTLFNIKVPGETEPLTFDSELATETSPMQFPKDKKFSDVISYVPNGSYPTKALTEIINETDESGKVKYARDDDGDSNFTLAGNLTTQWIVKEGETETPIDVLVGLPTSCKDNIVYMLKVSISDNPVKLSTEYGYPPDKDYPGNLTRTYYFTPHPSTIHACYGAPNPGRGGPGEEIYWGPASEWHPYRGFLLQDLNKPERNFPTTGSNGLHFDIRLVNATASTKWTYEQSPAYGISDIKLLDIADGEEGTIELYGPSDAVRPTHSFIPTTFIIKADDVPVYSFKISKWFVAHNADLPGAFDGSIKPGLNAVSFCNSMAAQGYRLPLRKDLVNNSVIFLDACKGDGTDEANPAGGENCKSGRHKRTIGKGLFSEWGMLYGNPAVGDYASPNSDFGTLRYFWTSERFANNSNYAVYTHYGSVGVGLNDFEGRRVTCVNP